MKKVYLLIALCIGLVSCEADDFTTPVTPNQNAATQPIDPNNLINSTTDEEKERLIDGNWFLQNIEYQTSNSFRDVDLESTTGRLITSAATVSFNNFTKNAIPNGNYIIELIKSELGISQPATNTTLSLTNFSGTFDISGTTITFTRPNEPVEINEIQFISNNQLSILVSDIGITPTTGNPGTSFSSSIVITLTKERPGNFVTVLP